jgi:hypothetical protein
MKQQDLALVSKADLTYAEGNQLNEKQLQLLLAVTPKQYVKQRPAKGGGVWEYVTGGYVRKVLNLMFGWDWDFEIVDEKIMHGEAIVKGRLTCRVNGVAITKMQYGNKDIMFKKDTDAQGNRVPLSIGNDLKAAATDALKKCAAEIGVAADIYNKEDFKPVKIKQSTEDVIDRKEYKRISAHIATATSIEELEMAEEHLKDDEQRELYAAKKEQLCK